MVTVTVVCGRCSQNGLLRSHINNHKRNVLWNLWTTNQTDVFRALPNPQARTAYTHIGSSPILYQYSSFLLIYNSWLRIHKIYFISISHAAPHSINSGKKLYHAGSSPSSSNGAISFSSSSIWNFLWNLIYFSTHDAFQWYGIDAWGGPPPGVCAMRNMHRQMDFVYTRLKCMRAI